jgi:hypothetical protein
MAMSLTENAQELPDLCGSESLVAQATSRAGPIFLPESKVAFDRIQSCFAIALHMHQPLIPAGGPDLRTAAIISNLQFMKEGPNSGDNYNASIYQQCYQRMGELIPRLVHEGHNPRVMLEYSGCLLHGLRQMGLEEVIDSLRTITCDRAYRPCIEWLGAPWGHAVAPSTPIQDYRLHVQAWQNHFASLFGAEALSRVKGFSPSEMALPNHPDICYEFVHTLLDCGYQWLLVQEHTVERVEDGGPVRNCHLPHRLVARNSQGQTLSITAIIKTQGSDTKLIGQMQPYYEAKGLSRQTLADKSVPPLVTQISDGENGGVMMNEFPSKYLLVSAEASGSPTAPANVTEYLEYLASVGITRDDLPAVQPIQQKRIWDRLEPGAGPEALAHVLEQLRQEDNRFHVEGGSWTNNISWVRGYDDLLGPMESASALFAQRVLAAGIRPSDPRYCNALYHLLMSQTSCYRYWGQGLWTDYGRELCRRTIEILTHDF